MQQQPRATLRAFKTLWIGQFISGLGSSLSAFAFGVWIFQTTGSATQFAISTFTYVLPFALLAPIAGALVDRWDRRWTMIGADCGQALITLVIAGLLLADRLAVWHIYGAIAFSAIFGSFHGPAYGASISLIVPPAQLARVAGLGRLNQALNRLVAPALAGILVILIGLKGVVLLDLATFLFAIFTYWVVSIPRPPRSAEATQAKGKLWREMNQVGYIYGRGRACWGLC